MINANDFFRAVDALGFLAGERKELTGRLCETDDAIDAVLGELREMTDEYLSETSDGRGGRLLVSLRVFGMPGGAEYAAPSAEDISPSERLRNAPARLPAALS